MTSEDQISITVQEEPLALIFERDDGKAATALIDAETALSLTIALLEKRVAMEAIRTPRIVKRLMIWILRRSWQKTRWERFKGNYAR